MGFKVLFVGSLPEGGKFTSSEASRAEEISCWLGSVLIEEGLDIIFGGTSRLDLKVQEGALKACQATNAEPRSRIVTYIRPGQVAAETPGSLIQVPSGGNFWASLIKKATACVGISGAKGVSQTLHISELMQRPTFPIAVVPGAAQLTWERMFLGKPESENLEEFTFLADRALPAMMLAKKTVSAILKAVTKIPPAPLYRKNLVFVSMPFAMKFDEIFSAIEDECRRIGLEAFRVDKHVIFQPILDEVKQKILDAEFVVFDLSEERPNVYYELGYAQGIGNQPNDIFLICNAETAIHFNAASMQVHKYGSTENLRGLFHLKFRAFVEARRALGE